MVDASGFFDLSDAVGKLPNLMSLDARGKFGYSCGFGAMRFGYVCFGFFSEYSGIYSRKKTLTGWKVSRERFYAPRNPQTATQQAWRAVFAEGWTQYRALTDLEKVRLSKLARAYQLSGPQLFMRYWLRRNLL